MRTLADEGCTIICTLHQPRAAIFDYVDKMLILCEGSTVFFGTYKQAIDYYEDAGYH